MDSFETSLKKLQLFRDRILKRDNDGRHEKLYFTKLQSDADDEDLMIKNCKIISEMVTRPDFLNNTQLSLFIRETVVLMFSLVNYQIESTRILICKYVFRVLKVLQFKQF
ncbi:hypothetical protein RF11_11489 [Thelohanellus kitauei]|uniref:Uncharacterized protein n=1 Tax=Thelohanellus kitauei TaxID=669202 RepID=A0A0C2NCJ5_THEKT|nr:hypothetical protein RF11_11489 [Thelohanellus kitauei]